MATNVTNVNDHIEAFLENENTALLVSGHIGTESRSGGCRRKLLFLGRSLLHLGCLSYNLYLIWLLVYLKDNPYYGILSLVPFFFNVLMPLIGILEKTMSCYSAMMLCCKKLLNTPSIGVAMTLMTCFTMLTRLAYYHRQPDEFIGPRFIIMSLQGSIILVLLDFYLQKDGELESLLKDKEALTRMLLDFVDIFNMVEILSVNTCVGVGSFVSENSSTEKAIQAFCTMSFLIIWIALDIFPRELTELPGSREEVLYTLVVIFSGSYQNLPFLVLRIVVWARYKLYSLGFLVKNVTAIVYFIAQYRKTLKMASERTSHLNADQVISTFNDISIGRSGLSQWVPGLTEQRTPNEAQTAIHGILVPGGRDPFGQHQES